MPDPSLRSGSLLRPGDRLLFQGDSITDADRRKDHDGAEPHPDRGRDLGRGYPMLIAAQLSLDHAAARIDVRNLGISGNRITDLAARVHEHAWQLAPQVLSILIGVNDIWHHYRRDAGVETARFSRTYDMLLSDTRARLPGVRLVLCEPFVLPCGAGVADANGKVLVPRADVDERCAIVADLARRHDAVLVRFQAAFDAALAQAPGAHFAADGVHPTPAGHLLMARTWLAAVGLA